MNETLKEILEKRLKDIESKLPVEATEKALHKLVDKVVSELPNLKHEDNEGAGATDNTVAMGDQSNHPVPAHPQKQLADKENTAQPNNEVQKLIENEPKSHQSIHEKPESANVTKEEKNGEMIPEALKNSGHKYTYGIDVSHFQGAINWDMVVRTSVEFAYMKATGGSGFEDPRFQENWHGSRQAGLLRGPYHFFYANESPEQQVEYFLSIVGQLRSDDLPPMLDVEIPSDSSKDRIQQASLKWLMLVEQKTGRLPIIYSDYSFANQYFDDPVFSKYPLWIAEYGKSSPDVPPVWREKGWRIWQHSQTGKVNGISGDVDLDTFNGSPQDLIKI